MTNLHRTLALRGLIVALSAVLLMSCASRNDREYRACITGFTVVGVGAGSAGGAGGAAMGGAAVGSAAALGLCQAPEAVASLEPGAIPAVPSLVMEEGDALGATRTGQTGPRCPDARGCAAPMVFDSQALNFAFDSADLPANAAEVLAPAVAFIAANPTASFRVTGHTDEVGGEAYNDDLSLRRARAVRDALVAAGVPVATLSLVGQGERSPVATNATESGRARNRRVEVELIP